MTVTASTGHKVPYWSLSRFYFFYFAALGAMLPYWSLFLKELGFHAEAIGWLTAIMTCTRIVAPNIWGWLADKTRRRLTIIRIGAGLGFAFFLGMFFARDFVWLALVIFCYSFFWNAILAQFEVITLSHLADRRNTYSHVRLWGSIGFIAAVVLMGVVFDRIDILYLPQAIAFLMLMIWLATLTVAERPVQVRHEMTQGLMEILKQPTVIAFFLVSFLLQVAHGPYYVFFSIHLENFGYSRALIGQLWALGVVAEVVIFIYMHRIMHRFSLRHIVLFSLLVSILRWLIIAYCTQYLPLLLVAQCFHAFSFGTLHASAIELVHRYFGGGHDGQGQAMYSASSFGAGAAAGAVLSGYIWASFGATATFTVSALLCALALLLAFIWFRSQQFQKSTS